MVFAVVFVLFVQVTPDRAVVEERLDLYEPSTMFFLGSERTWYDLHGRRMRLEIRDGGGAFTLRFLVLHDSDGRESEAIYFEGDATEPSRETFTYSPDGRVQTTTYYVDGEAADRTESVRDGAGREVARRYYRSDGTLYGQEVVHWNRDGTKLGWDFRYTDREGVTSFRYSYEETDSAGDWKRRTRYRDGAPDRIEVRSLVRVSRDVYSVRPSPGALALTDRAESVCCLKGRFLPGGKPVNIDAI